MIGHWFRRIFASPRASLLYEVTARCNLNCAHCYNVWKTAAPYCKDELPTGAAIDLIQKAVRESRCEYFTFTGGEPTLRPDLEELVKTAKTVCPRVNLISNGLLLDENRTSSLINAGVSLFELAIHSADKTKHNRMAGGIDCFDQATRAAAEIRARGAGLALVFVATSENIDDWEETLQLGIALGAQGFLFNRYNAGGKFHDRPAAILPSLEKLRHALEVAERYAADYGVGISASVPIPPCLIDPTKFPHVGFGFCPVGTEQAYWTIDPLGNVRPCNHSPTILGNILDEPFHRIKRSHQLAAFMESFPAACSGCKIRRQCQGGCKAAAQACYGSLTACEPFLKLNT